MSGARNHILAALEAARPPAAAPPTRVAAPVMPGDPESVLAARVEQSGGRLQTAEVDHWLSGVDWPIDLATTDHLYVCEALAGALPPRGVGAKIERLQDLSALEICVIEAKFAVVENGACWQIPSSPFERGAALLAEHLMVVVRAENLVPSLHQAYERIDLAEIDFGWFLCGPSKTADIEQALVLGAHGPRTMSLVLLRNGQVPSGS
jgi:L-lactate dehydrogenase complex protein LldG